MSQCKATVKSTGLQCRAKAGESGWCVMHDPARVKEATAARIAGGKKYSEEPVDGEIAPPTTAVEVRDILSRSIAATWSGKMDHRRAKAVRDLCVLQLRAIKDASEADAKESGDDFSTLSAEELRKLAAEMSNAQDG